MLRPDGCEFAEHIGREVGIDRDRRLLCLLVHNVPLQGDLFAKTRRSMVIGGITCSTIFNFEDAREAWEQHIVIPNCLCFGKGQKIGELPFCSHS